MVDGLIRPGVAFLLAVAGGGHAFGVVLRVNVFHGTAYVQLQEGHRGEIPLPEIEAGRERLAEYVVQGEAA